MGQDVANLLQLCKHPYHVNISSSLGYRGKKRAQRKFGPTRVEYSKFKADLEEHLGKIQTIRIKKKCLQANLATGHLVKNMFNFVILPPLNINISALYLMIKDSLITGCCSSPFHFQDLEVNSPN